MADFRRIVLVLAVLALCAGLASAQPMTCSANAYPTQIRSEGVTELMGDIVLQCGGGVPTAVGATIPQAQFIVYTNTTITSRLLASSGSVSEALLLVDDPGVSGEYIGGTSNVPTYGSQLPVIPCQTPLSGCAAVAGSVNYLATYPTIVPFSSGTTPAANEFFGIVSGNQVTFNGVPVLAPSSTGYTRYYRVTNVRVNANITGAGGLPGSIIADVAVSGNALSVPNSALTTSYVQQSLKTSLRNNSDGSTLSQTILQCNTNNGVTTSTTTPVIFQYLRYSEVFAQAFKTRVAGVPPAAQAYNTLQNVPGFNYLSESGFIPANGIGNYTGANAISTNNPPGLADYGTRLKAVFSNIPAGVNIYVSAATNSGSASTSVVLVPSATYLYGQGSLVGLTATTTTVYAPASTGTITLGLVQLPVSNGSATAVWEVINTATSTVENVDLPIAIQYTAAPSTNSPAIGTMTVNMEYGPTAADIGGTITAASGSQPIPRFIDTSTATTFFTVVQCTTSLLFPYVTEIAGFDTGLAIANTTTDPFATPAQAGTCTLYWYGTAAPANTVTASVASGTVWAGLTSLLAPGFNGYMIATCNFQYAHGFAFVSDLGARNLAMGYLALVMNQGSGSFRPIPTGEALEN